MGLNRINIKVSCSNMIENIDDKKRYRADIRL